MGCNLPFKKTGLNKVQNHMESGKASSDLNQIHVPSSKQMPPHEYLRNTLYIYVMLSFISGRSQQRSRPTGNGNMRQDKYVRTLILPFSM